MLQRHGYICICDSYCCDYVNIFLAVVQRLRVHKFDNLYRSQHARVICDSGRRIGLDVYD
jgi:hypothetical protein